ncbi:intraflagellar transport protein 74 homolog [Centruroides vittatus]|uniref:intraflagellar transport protein 74 homolog n=1 Tax=Centruroides vittatus TaxID=120091 RepID=UPI00350F1B4A
MDNRPPTSNRPLSGIRPFTSRRMSTGLPSRAGPPGTASRLITAASNRPGTRASVAQGIGVASHIMVTERPMSQQGLVTPRTGVRTQRRQIQDKSYFIGLLRSKVSELTAEIARMSREMESLSKEQSTYLTYEKRAEALAIEIKELQGELADHNLLVDKLNTDTEMSEVQEEYQDLKAHNEQETQVIDELFEQRQEKEAQVQQLETEIEQERHMTDNLISSMKPDLRKKYSDLKKTNQELQTQLEQLQQKSDALNTRRLALEEELALSQVKQEAVSLYERLRELEERRDNLLEEERLKGTPAQERERLLQQVKDDNAELASIERQTAEVREQITQAKEELEQLEQELDDHQGERSNKYRELRKREETIDSFLSSFDDNRTTEEEKQKQLQINIVALLERISRNLAHFQQLPTPQELNVLKDDLSVKEGEMEKSRSTVSTLDHEQKKLTMNLQQIEQLETKIQQELETLHQKIRTMEEEMETYSDFDGLRSAAEKKRQRLTEQEKILKIHSASIKKAVAELDTKYEEIQAKLNDNETYIQLTNLERRWQHQEQNNFVMKEFIANKKAETDYSSTQKDVFKLTDDYNKLLHDGLSRGTHG